MGLKNAVHNGTTVLDEYYYLPYNTHRWLLGPLIGQYQVSISFIAVPKLLESPYRLEAECQLLPQ